MAKSHVPYKQANTGSPRPDRRCQCLDPDHWACDVEPGATSNLAQPLLTEFSVERRGDSGARPARPGRTDRKRAPRQNRGPPRHPFASSRKQMTSHWRSPVTAHRQRHQDRIGPCAPRPAPPWATTASSSQPTRGDQPSNVFTREDVWEDSGTDRPHMAVESGQWTPLDAPWALCESLDRSGPIVFIGRGPEVSHLTSRDIPGRPAALTVHGHRPVPGEDRTPHRGPLRHQTRLLRPARW